MSRRTNRLAASMRVAVATLCLSASASAQEASDVHPFTRLGGNTVDGFTGWNLALHVGAIAATPTLIATDADYGVHRYFADHLEYDPYTVPAVYAGYAVPVLLGGGLYLGGLAGDDLPIATAGSAVLQASLLAVTYTSLLKAVTGRPNPDPSTQSDVRAASRKFRFGFLRGGIHYGWPSGHLGVNTAAMVSLFYLFPDALSVQLAGATYLGYLALGVAAHEGNTMHWLSDVVAGSLMGFAIGNAVGRGLRGVLSETEQQDASWSVLPVVSSDYTGVLVSARL